MAMNTDAPEGAGDPRRLTPVEVQQVQFRRSFRGYDEQEVDDFLDRITEELSALLDEKRDLAERADRADRLPTVPSQGVGGAAEAHRGAEEIRRRAREEAEAIVREAKDRSDALLRQARARVEETMDRASRGEGEQIPAGSTAGLGSFVAREREFLQTLASAIQDHASTVKDMVQAARNRQAPGAGETGGDAASGGEGAIAQGTTPGGRTPATAGRQTAGPGPDAAEDATAGPVAEPPAPGGPEAGSAGLPGVQTGGPLPEGGGDDAGGGVVRVPDAGPAPAASPGTDTVGEAEPAAPVDRPATQGSGASEASGIDWEGRGGPRMPQAPLPPRQLREPLPPGSLFPEAERETSLRTGTGPPPTISRQADALRRRRSDPDASLRELFWGED